MGHSQYQSQSQKSKYVQILPPLAVHRNSLHPLEVVIAAVKTMLTLFALLILNVGLMIIFGKAIEIISIRRPLFLAFYVFYAYVGWYKFWRLVVKRPMGWSRLEIAVFCIVPFSSIGDVLLIKIMPDYMVLAFVAIRLLVYTYKIFQGYYHPANTQSVPQDTALQLGGFKKCIERAQV
ncbi:hypothetical protein MP228_000720 [Amoeboaphelidium protococcarum]|nr:hypothetical protein MP228_000720 [Amoeboaphelidium protococcarum]